MSFLNDCGLLNATFQSFIITKSGHWTENWVGIHQPQSVFLKLLNLYMHHFIFTLRSGVLTNNCLGEIKCQHTSVGVFSPWIIRVNGENLLLLLWGCASHPLQWVVWCEGGRSLLWSFLGDKCLQVRYGAELTWGTSCNKILLKGIH